MNHEETSRQTDEPLIITPCPPGHSVQNVFRPAKRTAKRKAIPEKNDHEPGRQTGTIMIGKVERYRFTAKKDNTAYRPRQCTVVLVGY